MRELEAHFIFYAKTLKKWLTLCCTHDTIYTERKINKNKSLRGGQSYDRFRKSIKKQFKC